LKAIERFLPPGLALIHCPSFAAFVNGQRQGHTPEKPFKMGDSIAREMSEDRIPELNVASELALCAKTMEEAFADNSRTSLSAEEQQQVVDKKMKELGMTRLVFGLHTWTSEHFVLEAKWSLKQIPRDDYHKFPIMNKY